MSKKVLFLLVCIMPILFCCKTNSATQRQNQIEKQRKEKDKQAEKIYNEAKEKHLKNQTNQTRKQMRANKNKSEKARYTKKECFLKRWFTRKPNTCPKTINSE